MWMKKIKPYIDVFLFLKEWGLALLANLYQPPLLWKYNSILYYELLWICWYVCMFTPIWQSIDSPPVNAVNGVCKAVEVFRCCAVHAVSEMNHFRTCSLFFASHVILAVVFSIACCRACEAEPKPTSALSLWNCFNCETQHNEVCDYIKTKSKLLNMIDPIQYTNNTLYGADANFLKSLPKSCLCMWVWFIKCKSKQS